MDTRRLAIMSIAILMVLLTLFLLGFETYAGMSAALVSPLCAGNATCPTDEVCCFFPGEESGVCGHADYCEEIAGVAQEQQLAIREQAANTNVFLYYLPLFILSVMFAVVVFVYFK